MTQHSLQGQPQHEHLQLDQTRHGVDKESTSGYPGNQPQKPGCNQKVWRFLQLVTPLKLYLIVVQCIRCIRGGANLFLDYI